MPASLIDWSTIDHVLLDMDGTVLDLAYDNYFWMHLVPERYAERHGLTREDALKTLNAEFAATHGTLNWYCLDYWTAFTGLDITAMKIEVRHRIATLPGSFDFLHAVRESGRKLWLVTNAHHGSYKLKLAETGIGEYFDEVLSSHDFGAPKEDARFWPALQQRYPFDPERALFADDNLSVLRSAQAYGIGQIVAIGHPDSTAPKRVIEEFPAVDRLAQLLPVEGLAPIV